MVTPPGIPTMVTPPGIPASLPTRVVYPPPYRPVWYPRCVHPSWYTRLGTPLCIHASQGGWNRENEPPRVGGTGRMCLSGWVKEAKCASQSG